VRGDAHRAIPGCVHDCKRPPGHGSLGARANPRSRARMGWHSPRPAHRNSRPTARLFATPVSAHHTRATCVTSDETGVVPVARLRARLAAAPLPRDAASPREGVCAAWGVFAGRRECQPDTCATFGLARATSEGCAGRRLQSCTQPALAPRASPRARSAQRTPCGAMRHHASAPACHASHPGAREPACRSIR
jgi:hypothetical protein